METMIEQAIPTTETQEEKEYQGKHDVRPEGVSIRIFKAKTPGDAYYKERIKKLEKENASLREECEELRRACERLHNEISYDKIKREVDSITIESETLRELEKYKERAEKLEKQLIEALLK